MLKDKDIRSAALTAVVNIARLVVGLVFVFSGYVKAVDPQGTQLKIGEYLSAVGLTGVVPDWLTLCASILLSALEFTLGILTLFAIRRRLVSRLTLAFISIMTLITLWLVIFNPVKDCGCFGDALHLTNAESLLKNIVLLACALLLAWQPMRMYRFLSRSTQWIAINFTILYILFTSVACMYHLPFFDFRPYHVGMNIRQGMAIPAGAEQPEFETTFTLKKNGVVKEFTLDNYPDSTWQFVDSKTIQTKAGYVPPIHDFSIQKADGDDITDSILLRKGYTFLLISPHLSQADDSNFGNIDQLCDYAADNNAPFICLTASTEREIDHWINITGAEYPFCFTDETTLKTIIRSNPGLLLIKDGTIIQKWSHNDLPDDEELQEPLAKAEIGQMAKRSPASRLTAVVLGFFLPLIFLVIADRTWAWSKYARSKLRGKGQRLKEEETKIEEKSNKIISTFKKQKNNEKENRSRQLENE